MAGHFALLRQGASIDARFRAMNVFLPTVPRRFACENLKGLTLAVLNDAGVAWLQFDETETPKKQNRVG
jgi:hypothetical protein